MQRQSDYREWEQLQLHQLGQYLGRSVALEDHYSKGVFRGVLVEAYEIDPQDLLHRLRPVFGVMNEKEIASHSGLNPGSTLPLRLYLNPFHNVQHHSQLIWELAHA